MKSNDVVVAWIRVPLPATAFRKIHECFKSIYGPGLYLRQQEDDRFEVIRPGIELDDGTGTDE
jgi:hypothetical protein